MNSKTADYGIDGPVFIRNTFILGCLFVLSGLFLIARYGFYHSVWREILISFAFFAGAVCFWIALTILWGSRVGKLRLRDEIIASLDLKGDEKILGVGCGHGLLLVAAAKQLEKSGKAVGIDIWKEADQADNSPHATLENAQIEGVGERLVVVTGDARKLPFPDEYFDIVGSSWVLHNIIWRKERRKALAETVRVLKPGGKVVIIDVWLGFEYAKFLRQSGLTEISVSRPYFLFFAPTFIVRAVKK